MEIITQEEERGKVYVGIDVHLKTYAVTVIEAGRESKRWVMPARGELLIKRLRGEYQGRKIQSVYEAGFSGLVLHRELREAGIENIVVHAAAVAVSSRDRIKTDRRDSEKLAQHLAAGLLKGIRIPTIEEELRRLTTRTREQLVKARIRIMNQIRRRLVHFGYLTDYSGVLQRSSIKQFLEHSADNELKFCIDIQLRIWEQLDRELNYLGKMLQKQAAECPVEALYRSIPGIGKVSSRILANELGDMSQFHNEKALFRFVGLTPCEHSSGDKIRRGHISRQGNALLRKILVEAAWVAIRKDRALRSYYSRLAARAGGKRAIVALARKLIGRARAVIRKGVEYKGDVSEAVLAA